MKHLDALYGIAGAIVSELENPEKGLKPFGRVDTVGIFEVSELENPEKGLKQAAHVSNLLGRVSQN